MIPETLSHYRVLEKLGAGAIGEVYLAKDTKLDRTVALKILPVWSKNWNARPWARLRGPPLLHGT